MKPNKKKLKHQIREEKHSSKKYRRWGYPKIAKDESRHSRILQKELKKRT